MAITLNGAQVNSASVTGSTAITTSVTVGSGANKMVVALVSRGAGLHSAATMAFNTSESLTRVTSASATMDTSLWYLDNPTVTTADVTVSFGTTPLTGAKMTIWVLNGAEAGAPEDFDQATIVGGGVSPPFQVTLDSTAGAWVFSAAGTNAAGPFADDGGQTEGFNVDIATDAYGTGRFEDVSAGTVTPAWTGSGSGNGSISAISIAAAAAGSTTLPVDVEELVLSGQDVTLAATAHVTLSVDVGALAGTGEDSDFIYTVNWTEGALTLTGQDVTLSTITGEGVVVDVASALLTGEDVTLSYTAHVTVPVDVAAALLSGEDVTLTGTANVVVPVTAQSLVLIGRSIALIDSGAPPAPATGSPFKRIKATLTASVRSTVRPYAK